ncbi:hypothetical protein G647_03244 [Cladophialophora carrionii CBS 160.54]|uniref:Uncharacterized protein n=1 Tax=Cladophialophora carrionii CBS 160.54 TaxID=1279043 RepID=V9DKK4_9EURO|nr:uncharacterized protein G647_03244 [Cladophialophora carrionii CBS 160.54]ETI26467.1 hypothetical protein G647_03244 [Cladophialophora carrionii CBS 160.54]
MPVNPAKAGKVFRSPFPGFSCDTLQSMTAPSHVGARQIRVAKLPKSATNRPTFCPRLGTGTRKPTLVRTIEPTWSASLKGNPTALAVFTLNRDNQKKLKAFFDQVSKTNPWPGRFVKAVRSRQEAVLKKVEEIREKSVSDKKEFDAEIAPLLSAALGGLTDEPSDPASVSIPMQVRYLGAETQPYCEAMCGLLEQSGALALAYDELEGRPTHKSRLDMTEASFKNDREATESIVAAGKKVAAFQIERLLTDRYNEVRTPHDLTAEEEHQGKVLLSHGTHENPQSKPTPGWGNVAVDMERAVGRLCFAGEVEDGAR